MKHDAIVVGGGIAGLTSAAFLAKAGINVVLCEKEKACGGLVNTFEREGFFFDGGIRATEDSGVLFPMLRQLGLEIPFVKNHVSIGIKDRVIRIDKEEDADSYETLLSELYPTNRSEITEIFKQIRTIMEYMDVQYGIDNPAFLDIKEDREYFVKVILPWMLKYALTVPKISRFQEPVDEYLRQYTHNQSLLDIISQHFFQKTPAFFALSYIKLYLMYHYPIGGTGKIVEKMVSFIEDHQGTIRTDTKIVFINPDARQIQDSHGEILEFKRLIWAADQKTLYQLIDSDKLANPNLKSSIIARRSFLADKTGNDSVFTLYLALDLPPAYFANIASAHFFYTPSTIGQSAAGTVPWGKDRQTIEKWLEQFFALTTYEISCPVQRDSLMAPAGKTGLIVSVLFDYRLVKHIENMGWYEEFKIICEGHIIKTLQKSIYPGIKDAILQRFSSTPLTIETVTGNAEGAIVGWSYNNHPMPAEKRLPRILNAIKTPIPDIFQAGQWTYSPAGLPISILTGKLAADRVIRELRKAR